MKTPIVTFLFLFIVLQSDAQAIMVLKSSGKVVIGDTTQISTPGSYNLYVQNGILTERVKVSLKTTAEWLWQHMIRMEAENKALKEEVNQLKTGKSSDNK